LIGFVKEKWKAHDWKLEDLVKKIPFEWVDYYHGNLHQVAEKPFLFKFSEALEYFQGAPFNGQAQKKKRPPKYMQLRLGLKGWRTIKKYFEPKPVPELFWDDDEWIHRCFVKDGKPYLHAIDNFYVMKQWKFLLIGEKGTNMFFHKDATSSSSYQAQLVGAKKWTLCPNDQSHLLDSNIKTFQEEFWTHKKFARAHCGQVTVHAGEMVYYPGYMWHETLQLETPSIAYTGALVGTEIERDDVGRDRRPHKAFLNDMMQDCNKCWKRGNPNRICDDISKQWPGAAPPIFRVTCEEYLPKCMELWDEHAKNLQYEVGAHGEL